MTAMRRVYCVVWMLAMPLGLLAQQVHYREDVSVRNRKLAHYYKMVSWDDSPYREFAYYETSSTWAVMDFMNWRAIFPPGFNKNDKSKKYPAIIMLHGAGESGRKWTGHYQYSSTDVRYDNNGHHLLWGGREHKDAVNRLNYAVKIMLTQFHGRYTALQDPYWEVQYKQSEPAPKSPKKKEVAKEPSTD